MISNHGIMNWEICNNNFSLKPGYLKVAEAMSKRENTLGNHFSIRVQQNKTKLMQIIHFCLNLFSGAEHKGKTKMG